MSNAFTKLLLLGLLAHPAFSVALETLDLQLRYRSQTHHEDVLEQSIATSFVPFELMELTTGARYAQSNIRPYTIGYLLEAQIPRKFFISLRSRLFHLINTQDDFSSTQALAYAHLKIPIAGLAHFFLSFGRFHRSTNLSAAALLPSFNASVGDSNWATQFGFLVYLSRTLQTKLWAGTFDRFEVLNLNNPFFQIDVTYRAEPNAIRYGVMARYGLALGFGRLSEFLFGANVDIPWDLI